MNSLLRKVTSVFHDVYRFKKNSIDYCSSHPPKWPPRCLLPLIHTVVQASFAGLICGTNGVWRRWQCGTPKARQLFFHSLRTFSLGLSSFRVMKTFKHHRGDEVTLLPVDCTSLPDRWGYHPGSRPSSPSHTSDHSAPGSILNYNFMKDARP